MAIDARLMSSLGKPDTSRDARPRPSRRAAARSLAVALCLFLAPASAPAEEPSALTRAVDALLAVQKDEGLFAYDFDFVRGKSSKRNSIVRQAGTVYALAEYYGYSRDERLREPLRRALKALGRVSVEFGGGAGVSKDGSVAGIRVGAIALTLLAEAYYFRASGDGRFEPVRRAWIRGMLALQRPGAGFKRAPGAEVESPYYNGEVWLALALLARTFEDREIDRALAEVEPYLMATYGREPHIGFFHWGLMAASMRWRATGDSRYADFLRDQVRHYLQVLRPKLNPNANTCYALEGMFPALEPIGTDEALQAALRSRVQREFQKILGFQIRPAQDRLDLGDGTVLISPRLQDYVGAFVAGRKRPSTRIDFTQHCISALIKARVHALDAGLSR